MLRINSHRVYICIYISPYHKVDVNRRGRISQVTTVICFTLWEISFFPAEGNTCITGTYSCRLGFGLLCRGQAVGSPCLRLPPSYLCFTVISGVHPFCFLANCRSEEMLYGNVFSMEKEAGLVQAEENSSERVLTQDLNELDGTCRIPRAKARLKGTIWVPPMSFQL